ncbi:MAG: hypothetical protein WA047_04360 [Phenylobacterium sp.]|uniref:hypothetical protein n=1 Tax=Phenylobacterium sp. TaxID=1871053 RepID=UPI003BB6A006
MWSKLAWDADVCRDVQISYPRERQPLAYAAINVCIAASSLRDWVISELTGRARAAGLKIDEKAHHKAMNAAVPEQAMCEAIANTAKHARHRDGGWPGGQVSLEWQEGDEDCPPGYMLHHLNGSGCAGALAVNSFEALCGNWWNFLRALDLAGDRSRTPEWQQNKLRRIFGDHDGMIVPAGCQPQE